MVDDPAATQQRCALPECGEPMDRWPYRCRRVAGHDGDFHGPRNPFIIGPPVRNAMICRICGKEILADEPYRRVIRFAWLRGGHAFAHDVKEPNVQQSQTDATPAGTPEPTG